jgi:hypothetical protein
VRIASSITSITWVPFGILDRLPQIPLSVAMASADEPPPEVIRNLQSLRGTGAFREGNELRAWIEVEGGRIVDFGHEGGGVFDVPAVDASSYEVAFPGMEFPVIRPQPDARDDRVRFLQTVGGRIGLPVPRPVPGKPYLHVGPASAWTTLALTICADGRSRGSLVGASPFPSHWLYDAEGRVVEKRESIDLAAWQEEQPGGDTPWGPEDAPTLASELESELARSLLRSGVRMERRRLGAGETLVTQGEPGDELYLLLIGTLDVEVDGETVAQVGAGAIVGERAVLEGGRRTATLRAATPARVAVLAADSIDRSQLRQLALGRPRR